MTCEFFQRLEPRTLLSAGALDSSFGDHGIELITSDRFVAITTSTGALQSDGKVLLAGNNYGLAAIARFQSNGAPDRTFGNNDGIVTIRFPGDFVFQISSVVVAGDRILAGGTLSRQNGPASSGLVRLKSDGSIDPSFGKNGYLADDANATDSLSALLVTRGGKILAGGAHLEPDGKTENFVVSRFNADGSLDRTFGRRGRVVTVFSDRNGSQSAGISAMALTPDGKIIAAGQSGGALDLVRYNASGSLDTSFNRSGKFGVRFYSGKLHALAVRADGEIFATAGRWLPYYPARQAQAMTVLAVTPRGKLVQTFGDHGVAQVFVPSGGRWAAQADGGGIQPLDDGDVIVSGHFISPYRAGPFLARLNSKGSLDANFGEQGVQMLGKSVAEDTSSGLIAQRDGKFIVPFSGHFLPDVFATLHAVRFGSDGKVDQTFAYGRHLGVSNGPTMMADNATDDATVESDGTILRLASGDNVKTLVDRRTASGSPLPFANGDRLADGNVATDLEIRSDVYAPGGNIAALPNGKFLVAEGGVGWSLFLPEHAGTIERFNADGMLDPTFGDGGTVKLKVGLGGFGRMIILPRPDGSVAVYIATSTRVLHMPSFADFLVLLDADGHVLKSTMLSESRTLAVGPTEEQTSVGGIVQTADGKFIVSESISIGQYPDNPAGHSIIVKRLNADFSLDTSFGIAGSVTLHPRPVAATNLAVALDGSIYIEGHSVYPTVEIPFIARITRDGALDTRFGQGGYGLGLAESQYSWRNFFVAQADGKLVTATVDGKTIRFARYNTDGARDTTFGNDGHSIVHLGAGVSLQKLLLQGTVTGTKLLAVGTLDLPPAIYSEKQTEGFLVRVDL